MTSTLCCCVTVSKVERAGDGRLPVHVYVSALVALKGLNVKLDVPLNDVRVMPSDPITFPLESIQTVIRSPVNPAMFSLTIQLKEYSSPAMGTPLALVTIDTAFSGTEHIIINRA